MPPFPPRRRSAPKNGFIDMAVDSSQTIESVADEMLTIANHVKADVRAVLNGTLIELRWGALVTREDLIKFYREDQLSRKGQLAGPIQVYKNPTALIAKNQQVMNLLMVEMHTLEFYLLESVIDWFLVVHKNQLAEVEYKADDIVAKLEGKGFESYEAMGSPKLSSQSGVEFGMYVVGRALSDLKAYGSLTDTILTFGAPWKRKYGGQGIKQKIGGGGFGTCKRVGASASVSNRLYKKINFDIFLA